MTRATDPAPRRRLRNPFRVESRVKGDHDPRFLGYLGDISESGAFVQCSRPRLAGTPVALRLHLSGRESGPVDLEGHVIWSRGYGGRLEPCAGMGIQFRSLEPDARVLLREFCQGSDPEVGPRL